MNHVITAPDLSSAWVSALEYLMLMKKGAYNTTIGITSPLDENLEISSRLNRFLLSNGDREVATVANTIFPYSLWLPHISRKNFYESYFSLYPMIRKLRENNRGTYFGRMVAWNHVISGTRNNQLEQLIVGFTQHRELGKAKQHVLGLNMSIYNPHTDSTPTMGFPCMSHIIVVNDENRLNLTAVYRNQYFIMKAYGNYVGLGRLLNFICEESGYKLGNVTCVATHAELDGTKEALRPLINSLKPYVR